MTISAAATIGGTPVSVALLMSAGGARLVFCHARKSGEARIATISRGIAGLGTTYFLGDAGLAVELYGAAPRPGGLARGFKWHCFDCDLRPHCLITDDADLLNETNCLAPFKRVRRSVEFELTVRRWCAGLIVLLQAVSCAMLSRYVRVKW